MLNIVLYEPEIPPNTGNVIRLAANTGAKLALIEPFGFELSDTRLKRAGLDYHELAHMSVFGSLDEYLAEVDPARVFAFSTKGNRHHHTVAYRPGDSLLFGPETRGLPEHVLDTFGANVVRIPMQPRSRSLNLANAVSIGLFEAWRQIGFDGAQ